MGGSKAAMGAVKDAAIAIGGGVIAGVAVNKLPIPNPKLKAAAPIAIGAGMLFFGAKKRNPLITSLATGMMVLGGVALIKQQFPQVPILAGEDDDNFYLPGAGGYPLLGDTVELGDDSDVDVLEDLDGDEDDLDGDEIDDLLESGDDIDDIIDEGLMGQDEVYMSPAAWS